MELFHISIAIILHFLANSVSLPFEVSELGYGGSVMAIIGLAIIIRGMYELKVKGKGLPMNAFPPEELVEDGIYGIFPHPIYFGFCIMCIGISIFYKSAAGLYLVTPVIIGGCMALVLGYEKFISQKKNFEKSSASYFRNFQYFKAICQDFQIE